MTTTLITAATRGVGLGLARRLVGTGHDGLTGTFVDDDGPLPW